MAFIFVVFVAGCQKNSFESCVEFYEKRVDAMAGVEAEDEKAKYLQIFVDSQCALSKN